ncbi:fluoride efflux transporter CrcB [Lederbergia lenta]|uniref:Fluoride-specific ion channel FluC n=1 Tax=Lederbergia lenta TaxID=1467 RepID=A0A2X4WPL8_LEDLE|nr:fluoride efflux transporter CrcB [Lederbergia lenta]MCM3109727.1 fluoride efflux transporter CrcB [Lederbergia lenta]MEC2324522.1 fluoride efflux transporter CrcB [Lederbergia lenta]SQI59600.1 crcB protein [Lederbergia lenta]
MKYLAVGLGGMVGSVLRYFVGNITLNLMNVPIGTFLVNLIGSLLLGLLTGLTTQTNKISPIITVCIGTGMIGSFTTFSTFSTEIVMLFQNEHYFLALIYVSSSILLGLLLAFYGYYLGAKPSSNRGVRS